MTLRTRYVRKEEDLSWTIVAVADFRGDGQPDILWRNSVSGAIRVSHMDGVRRTGLNVLEPGSDMTWTIGGVGDFNRDGKPDIVWRSPATGHTRIWYMDGATQTGQVMVSAVTKDLAWVISPGALGK